VGFPDARIGGRSHAAARFNFRALTEIPTVCVFTANLFIAPVTQKTQHIAGNCTARVEITVREAARGVA
jgi:hypothetical protein